MSDTNLPWMIFGRKIRPYSLFLSIACAVSAWSLLTHSAAGKSLDGTAGIIVGICALAAVLFLWLGYLLRNDILMRHGLMTSIGSWSAVGTFLALEQASPTSSLLAFCWAGASAGAYLLEIVEKDDSE